MDEIDKLKRYNHHVSALTKLITESVPESRLRLLHGTKIYFYKTQLLIAFSGKGSTLHIQTAGRTPQARRQAMKPYMTFSGNIKIRPSQNMPGTEIKKIILDRKAAIDRHPYKRSLTYIMSAGSKNDKPLPRHEKTAQRIKRLERLFPALKQLTQHPKVKPWVVTVTTVLEVGMGLLALFILVPWLLSLLPTVSLPMPTINLPSIPIPAINLPNWELPFNIPRLPEWLQTIVYWFNKTLPIWIALFFAVRSVKKNNSSAKKQRKK